ncbi:MAG: OmpA family protein, partial [Giesbergeria sp.]
MVRNVFARWLVWLALALCAASAGAAVRDVTGGRDHPLVQRFPGAVLIGYGQIGHGSLEFQTTTYTGFDLDKGQRRYAEPPLSLDGRVTRLWYEAAGSTTAAQLYDSHARALVAQGFQTLYDSAQDKGAAPAKWVNFLASFAPGKRDALVNNRTPQVFSAARPASLRTGTFQQDNTTVRLVAVDWPQGDAASKARQGAYIAIDIVEARVLRDLSSPVVAPPAATDSALNKALSGPGRATLAGVQFVSGSAQFEEGARAALAGVAAYLKAQPEARLYVVGHTDGVGGIEGNLELSLQRAQAVVEVLERDFTIAPGRLSAHGVGPLAPIADNST